MKKWRWAVSLLVGCPADQSKNIKIEFPVHASPQDWDPWTGETRPEYGFKAGNSRVDIEFELPPYGSKLIVFDPADRHGPRAARPPADVALPGVVLSGGGQKWILRAGDFQLDLTDLVDWLQIDKLKGYSGKAEYEATFVVDTRWLENAHQVLLDLGNVHDVAEIRLNGKAGPSMLLRPFRADITALLKPGENELKIKVTNSWTNRLLSQGVSLANAAGPKPEPEPSGLIGPVKLIAR